MLPASGKDKSRVCSKEADKFRIHKNYESISLIFLSSNYKLSVYGVTTLFYHSTLDLV